MKRDKQIFIHNGNGKVQYQFLKIDFCYIMKINSLIHTNNYEYKKWYSNN